MKARTETRKYNIEYNAGTDDTPDWRYAGTAWGYNPRSATISFRQVERIYTDSKLRAKLWRA
jgi:hypothetical protein